MFSPPSPLCNRVCIYIEYVTDNELLAKTFNGGRRAGKASINAALFSEIFAYISSKELYVKVRWMPSDTQTKQGKTIPPDVTAVDVLANALADTYAQAAANDACLPLDVTADIIQYYNLASRIQKRLVAIIKDLPSRPRPRPRPKLDKISLDHAIILSSHIIYRQGERFCCARCRQSHPRAGIREWLNSKCDKIGTSQDKPTPLEFSRYRAGNQVAHVSHKLNEYRGLVYCRKCGYRSHTKMHKLAHPCIPDSQEASSSGKANINRINRGLLPYNLVAWPDENVYDLVTTQVCGSVSFRTVEQMSDFTQSYNIVLAEETSGRRNTSSSSSTSKRLAIEAAPTRDLDDSSTD